MKYAFLYILLIFLSMKTCYAQFDEDVHTYFKVLSEYKNENTENAIKILSQESENPRSLKLLANIHYKNEKFSEAIKYYNSLIELNPSEAYYGLAKTYAIMGYEKESLHFLEQHFLHDNSRSNAEINMEPAFHVIDRTRHWRAFWDEPRYSRNTISLQKAENFINFSQEQEAINYLYSLRLGGKYENYKNYLLSKAYFNNNNYNRALNYINLSLQREGQNVQYLEHRFLIYRELERDKDALEDISLLLKLDKFNPDYYKLKAITLNNTKDYNLANKYIDYYLDYFVKDEEALHFSAIIKTNMEYFSDALIVYNRLLELNPSRSDYYIERGDIFFHFKNWNFAMKDYSMALDIDPLNAEAYYLHGWSRYKMNDKKGACASWNRASRLKHREAAKAKYNLCK